MGIGFDRASAGEGVETCLRLETGRAYLEWRFHYTEQPRRERLSVRLKDARQETVMECLGLAAEEEALQGVLLQPRLWDGSREPYLYTLEATLWDSEGVCLDQWRRQLPLYSLERKGDRGVFLNGAPCALKTVRYEQPENMTDAEQRKLSEEDLQKLRKLGANSVFVACRKGLEPFLQLCERKGILVLTDASYLECGTEKDGFDAIPVLRNSHSGAEYALLRADGQATSEFYRYRAKWSGEPFVYLVPESVRRQRNGNFCATVYSSCQRIALYSDGALFEFQRGQGEFYFREIPAKGPCVALSVEGDGCGEAFSVHKSFTKLLSSDEVCVE